MLVFENVSYQYPGGHGLKNVSFSIGAGEQVGLIGANGAGKSTLMKLALGLLTPTAGKIYVDGAELTAKNLPEVRKSLGYVLQDSDNQMFMPKVIDDMVFGPMNYGKSREQAEETAREITRDLGVEFLLERHNHRISGGEKRMAAIATILAMEPKVMLMDEPSAALDPKNRRRVINTLNRLPQTKLIASHDLDMILETCDRVLLLSHGTLLADGKAGQILRNREMLERCGLELPFCLAGVRERK